MNKGFQKTCYIASGNLFCYTFSLAKGSYEINMMFFTIDDDDNGFRMSCN